MCNSYFKMKIYCFLAFAACCILSASPAVAQTYFNDFEGVVGSEWSNDSTDIAPAGARTFLGQFGNETVSLTLTSVPACNVTVSFELFIIHSWDGHHDEGPGPDVWDLSVGGGPTLLHTTFATHDPRIQAYPATYTGGTGQLHNLPHTGAAEINSLGFLDFFGTGDVYNLSFTFAHAGGALVLDFSATGLQGLDDESWGLDNVLVIIEIEVPVDIKPETLNLNSKGVFTAFIDLPEGFDEEDIDISTVKCEGAPALKNMMADDGRLIVKFDRKDLDGVSPGDEVEMVVTGQLNDGTHFRGSDTIRVIEKGK